MLWNWMLPPIDRSNEFESHLLASIIIIDGDGNQEHFEKPCPNQIFAFYRDDKLVRRVLKACTEAFYMQTLMNELSDMITYDPRESLQSIPSHHLVTVESTHLSSIKVENSFFHLVDNDFQLDSCKMTIIYDPYSDSILKEEWEYIYEELSHENEKSRQKESILTTRISRSI